MTEKFRSVHELLHDAAIGIDEARPIHPKPRTIQSFQVALDDKQKLDEICRSNSSTASAFLRACVSELIKDYE